MLGPLGDSTIFNGRSMTAEMVRVVLALMLVKLIWTNSGILQPEMESLPAIGRTPRLVDDNEQISSSMPKHRLWALDSRRDSILD